MVVWEESSQTFIKYNLENTYCKSEMKTSSLTFYDIHYKNEVIIYSMICEK